MSSVRAPALDVVIRLACGDDIPRLAELCEQLGYPAVEEEVHRRFQRLVAEPTHAVYVAEVSTQVVGWIHLYDYTTLMIEPLAMVGGLVVDAAYRGLGIGRRLMTHAEQWALDHGCTTVYLKSNAIRVAAHAFYKALGYQIVKTQFAFRKDLVGTTENPGG
ncbi:MAG: GNAT family N-acetyltransferase [Anaerolineae bacterium]|nr:GNAT family N-acetyltransferase [Anaerolineae bacterium]